MRRMQAAFIGLTLAAGGASQAQAVDITVAPRAWYLVDALASGELEATNGGQGEFSFTSPAFDVPMFGGSVSIHSSSFLPNTTLTLTALYGKDTKYLTTRSGNVLVTASGRDQLFFSLQNTRQTLKRGDFELTAQTRINDLISWTVGARYERARVDFLATITNTSSNPFTGAIVTRVQKPGPYDGGYNLYTVRAGAALLAPLNENSRDFLYGSFMVFGGHRSNIDRVSAPQYNNATYIGPDLAVGYTHRLSRNVVFDARYRALFFFPISGAGEFGSPKATHGPTLGLSYSF